MATVQCAERCVTIVSIVAGSSGASRAERAVPRHAASAATRDFAGALLTPPVSVLHGTTRGAPTARGLARQAECE